jgi:parallel beta-helix repeat protein
MSRPVTTDRLASALRLAIAATFVLNVSIRAEAATYYVSLSGSDARSCAAAETIGTPKRSIKSALTCLQAGDTLYIRGGTYTTSSDVIDNTAPSGTSSTNRVIIAGYPGESVTLQPPNGVHAFLLTINQQYIETRNLVFDYANDTTDREGIYVSGGAHHIRFFQVEVKNANNFGVVFARGSLGFNEFVDGAVHHSGDPAGTSNIRGHAFYISCGDNLIEATRVYDNEGYGLHFYDNGGALNVSRNVIRQNRIYNNGLNHTTAYGVILDWGADNLVYNNLIFGNNGGVLVYGNTTNTQVYNNTIVGNRNDGVALQYYSSAPIIRNNIVDGNGSAITDYGGTGTPVIDHNLTSNPLFVNRTSNDFRLMSTSPARDAGAVVPTVENDFDGVARPQNGAYDVGAFEYPLSISSGPRAVTGVRIVRGD